MNLELTNLNAPIFCTNISSYSRFLTREVTIGSLPMGGKNPIRIQSMTTTNTMDTLATVAQCIRMIEAGCEYIRITAPSINEAKNLELIKKNLRNQGYTTPLIADIHYTPNAAEYAARIVEKVRINPGNYADKKSFKVIEYTERTYQDELDRIRERFVPLIRICKEYGTAMRIGTNHGSLSDRILSRFGDTPLGMVESAIEFLRICEDEGFYNVVLSMKASNTLVMVQAYRLLVHKMIETGRAYPLHLGVTEAGDGEDGRIKSAVGIGALLEDGLGDTLRVSLTEEPEFELPVARALAQRYILFNQEEHGTEGALNMQKNLASQEVAEEWNKVTGYYFPFELKKRVSKVLRNLGGTQAPRVIGVGTTIQTPSDLLGFGYAYDAASDKWTAKEMACDYIYTGNSVINFPLPGLLGIIVSSETWINGERKAQHYPIWDYATYLAHPTAVSPDLNFIALSTADFLTDPRIPALVEKLSTQNFVCVLEATGEHPLKSLRQVFIQLNAMNCPIPVIIRHRYNNSDEGSTQLYAAADFGGLFVDGFGEGIWIDSKCNAAFIASTSFGILQATRTRISKTEYISCPSCGRTLFNLQETTAKIRARTAHLKGLKIGIMGCIVNGPGEMADADYGYVGTGVGKITLYKGKTVVERNIASDKAVDLLIDLIRANGDWIEPT